MTIQERLREIKWGYPGTAQEAADHIDIISAENERLREALRVIQQLGYLEDVWDVARNALS